MPSLIRQLATAPTAEPVSLEEVKVHLRVHHDDDDAYITALIEAAREQCELWTERRFVTQVWDIWLDCFQEEIELPYPPLQSVDEVEYTDTDGNLQTASSSLYVEDTASQPGRLYLADGQSWPSAKAIRKAVRIRFTAGYGEASAVPERAKQAIKLLVAHWYANREAVVVGMTATELPHTAKMLLYGLRMPEAA